MAMLFIGIFNLGGAVTANEPLLGRAKHIYGDGYDMYTRALLQEMFTLDTIPEVTAPQVHGYVCGRFQHGHAVYCEH